MAGLERGGGYFWDFKIHYPFHNLGQNLNRISSDCFRIASQEGASVRFGVFGSHVVTSDSTHSSTGCGHSYPMIMTSDDAIYQCVCTDTSLQDHKLTPVAYQFRPSSSC